MSDRRLGPEAPSVLADVSEPFTKLVGSSFRSRDQSLFLLDIGEPFIAHIGSPFRSRDHSLFLLDNGKPFLHISVRRLGPEANLYFCLISASRLLQISDRHFLL